MPRRRRPAPGPSAAAGEVAHHGSGRAIGDRGGLAIVVWRGDAAPNATAPPAPSAIPAPPSVDRLPEPPPLARPVADRSRPRNGHRRRPSAARQPRLRAAMRFCRDSIGSVPDPTGRER
jgi:hypothetical protein